MENALKMARHVEHSLLKEPDEILEEKSEWLALIYHYIGHILMKKNDHFTALEFFKIQQTIGIEG